MPVCAGRELREAAHAVIVQASEYMEHEWCPICQGLDGSLESPTYMKVSDALAPIVLSEVTL
jgi:hypothetical protein